MRPAPDEPQGWLGVVKVVIYQSRRPPTTRPFTHTLQRRRSANFGDFQDHCFFEYAASGSELPHAVQILWMIPFSFFGIWVNGGAGVSIIGGGGRPSTIGVSIGGRHLPGR